MRAAGCEMRVATPRGDQADKLKHRVSKVKLIYGLGRAGGEAVSTAQFFVGSSALLPFDFQAKRGFWTNDRSHFLEVSHS